MHEKCCKVKLQRHKTVTTPVRADADDTCREKNKQLQVLLVLLEVQEVQVVLEVLNGTGEGRCANISAQLPPSAAPEQNQNLLQRPDTRALEPARVSCTGTPRV